MDMKTNKSWSNPKPFPGRLIHSDPSSRSSLGLFPFGFRPGNQRDGHLMAAEPNPQQQVAEVEEVEPCQGLVEEVEEQMVH